MDSNSCEAQQFDDIRYFEGIQLKLGGEGRKQLLKLLRQKHAQDKESTEQKLAQLSMSYGGLRNAKIGTLVKMAQVCGLWKQVVAIHITQKKSPKKKGKKTSDPSCEEDEEYDMSSAIYNHQSHPIPTAIHHPVGIPSMPPTVVHQDINSCNRTTQHVGMHQTAPATTTVTAVIPSSPPVPANLLQPEPQKIGLYSLVTDVDEFPHHFPPVPVQQRVIYPWRNHYNTYDMCGSCGGGKDHSEGGSLCCSTTSCGGTSEEESDMTGNLMDFDIGEFPPCNFPPLFPTLADDAPSMMFLPIDGIPMEVSSM